jgi:hypothetical protein
MPPDGRSRGPHDVPEDFDFVRIVETFRRHSVEYAVVGAMADVLHGSDLGTRDADILVKVDAENLAKLRSALVDLQARPTPEAEVVLANPEQFVTDAGLLDVFEHVEGAGSYEDVLSTIEIADLDGLEVPHLDLMTLIKTRQAAGRPADERRLQQLRLIARELGLGKVTDEPLPERPLMPQRPPLEDLGDPERIDRSGDRGDTERD